LEQQVSFFIREIHISKMQCIEICKLNARLPEQAGIPMRCSIGISSTQPIQFILFYSWIGNYILVS